MAVAVHKWFVTLHDQTLKHTFGTFSCHRIFLIITTKFEMVMMSSGSTVPSADSLLEAYGRIKQLRNTSGPYECITDHFK